MRSSDLSRFVLNACVAAAMLAGCGGSQTMNVTPTIVDPPALPHHLTFRYTGKGQSFIVPTGVKSIRVVARGAGGGAPGASGEGADGGRLFAVIPVTPSEILYVFVGGRGTKRAGGFNGGGDPGTDYYNYTFGGGGASDVREDGSALADRVLVVGGGGGKGDPVEQEPCGSQGGSGGGLEGASGVAGCRGAGGSQGGGAGGGGTQSQGGFGGAGGASGSGSGLDGGPGSNGVFGSGGGGGKGGYSGYSSSSNLTEGGGGGGGGGGYYGGGGGGGGGAVDEPVPSAAGGGGGGGCSFAESRATHVKMWQGWYNASGNGLVVFSW